jgi:phosphonate transport system substrate-binding protein
MRLALSLSSRMRCRVFSFLGIGLSLTLGLSVVHARLSVSELVVALKPDKNPDAMLAEQRALQTFLGDRLSSKIRVIVPLSTAVIVEGLANGTIDLGYLSATDMARIRTQGSASLLLAGEFPGGQRSYRSYWLTLRDKPYTSIEQLRGKPVAFASRTSTSGFLVPLLDLRQRGLVDENGALEAFFGRGNVLFGVGYVSAIERVFAGDAEAAAVSDYVFDQDKHLTAEQRGRLRVLQSQGPVPSHVLAVRASLPAADQTAIRTALLGMNEPPHAALRDRVFTTKLVAVSADEHLAPLAAALPLAERALAR